MLLLNSNKRVAEEGKHFSLSCYLIEVLNTTEYHFSWLKNGQPVSVDVDGVSVNSSAGLSTLQFASLKMNHSGSYQCAATTDIQSTVVNITVLGKHHWTLNYKINTDLLRYDYL